MSIFTENTVVAAKEEGGRGEKDWEFGISRYKLLYTGWIDEKLSLYSTGKDMQELKTKMWKESEKR